MGNYNGKIQSVRRRYDSLRNFVGKNQVHLAGDVLCVSTKNNDVYDLFLYADGVSDFITLYKNRGNVSPGGSVPVEPNNDGRINTFGEILYLLRNLPEGSDLGAIVDAIDKKGLTEEERQILDDMSGDQLSEEDIENIYFPKNVNGISADESGEAVILMLEGENIEDDDTIEWTITVDGTALEPIEATGTTLTLDAEKSATFKAAKAVTAQIYVGGYESEAFTLKGSADHNVNGEEARNEDI